MRTNPRRFAIGAALLAAVGACGGSADETLPRPAAAPAASTTSTTDAATTTTAASTTTVAVESAGPAPTTTSTTTTTTLPGEPVDVAIAGTVAHVPGVAFDETFVVRTLPGDEQPEAASLPALTPLVFTGRAQEIDSGRTQVPWVEVTAGDVTGWISQWSLVYLGAPRDITDEVVSAIGMQPTAPTMLELGQMVLDADPETPPPDVVLAAAPGDGPTAEVVYDVFPDEAFGDDAARGARLRVTGRQVPADDLPETAFAASVEYELVSVEASSLCTRGVDAATGACI